jgi:hypothetical protein
MASPHPQPQPQPQPHSKLKGKMLRKVERYWRA